MPVMEIYMTERDGQALVDASSFVFSVVALVSLYRSGIKKGPGTNGFLTDSEL